MLAFQKVGGGQGTPGPPGSDAYVDTDSDLCFQAC